jgi:DMSO reductase anchor subunit
MMRKIFDSENSSGWLILAIVTFAIGLLISFFSPVVYSMTRFRGDQTIAYSPSGNTVFYQILAFFLLGFGLYIIYRFKHKFVRISGGIVGVVLFGLVSTFAFNSYTHIHNDYIEIGKGYTIEKYAYDEIEEFYLQKASDVQFLTFKAKDGSEFEVVFGGLIDSWVMTYIRRTLEEYGLKMTDIS